MTVSSAYLRTLRDIYDGHIGVYADVSEYDPYTGERLPEPIVNGIGADREPSYGLPDRDGTWWEPMVEAGHLALFAGLGRHAYLVTDAGRNLLQDSGLLP